MVGSEVVTQRQTSGAGHLQKDPRREVRGQKKEAKMLSPIQILSESCQGFRPSGNVVGSDARPEMLS